MSWKDRVEVSSRVDDAHARALVVIFAKRPGVTHFTVVSVMLCSSATDREKRALALGRLVSRGVLDGYE